EIERSRVRNGAAAQKAAQKAKSQRSYRSGGSSPSSSPPVTAFTAARRTSLIVKSPLPFPAPFVVPTAIPGTRTPLPPPMATAGAAPLSPYLDTQPARVEEAEVEGAGYPDAVPEVPGTLGRSLATSVTGLLGSSFGMAMTN
ncbi:hypothetical protein Vretimale_18735, partial [Volvox reticuliferus]